ncbi:unnamed protein product, partial [Bubo scandiacus]
AAAAAAWVSSCYCIVQLGRYSFRWALPRRAGEGTVPCLACLNRRWMCMTLQFENYLALIQNSLYVGLSLLQGMA